jgi:hypothetical protein
MMTARRITTPAPADMSTAEIDRNWLVNPRQTSQYAPQLGDRVMYFPQGHLQWWEKFPESASPPWLAFSQKWPVVECEVRRIEYAFPDPSQESTGCYSVEARVQLVVTRVPVRNVFTAANKFSLQLVEPSASKITFTVTLRDWDLPEVLVPADIFQRAIEQPWPAGSWVTVPFKEWCEDTDTYTFKAYRGQVLGISNASEDWPNSPWDCVQVRWASTGSGEGDSDRDSQARICPWEASLASADEVGTGGVYGVGIDPHEAARMEKAIKALKVSYSQKCNGIFVPFVQSSHAAKSTRYYALIPVPITLGLIRDRLRNRYYRQVQLDRALL